MRGVLLAGLVSGISAITFIYFNLGFFDKFPESPGPVEETPPDAGHGISLRTCLVRCRLSFYEVIASDLRCFGVFVFECDVRSAVLT